VLEKHCISNGRTYEQLLSAVRGQVIHEGHLALRSVIRSEFFSARQTNGCL
jgi:hypothetical protein